MTSFETTLCINDGPHRRSDLAPPYSLVVLPPHARGNYVMRSCGHRRLAFAIAPEYCVERPRVDCVWPREIHELRLFRPCGLGRIRAVKQAVLAIANIRREWLVTSLPQKFFRHHRRVSVIQIHRRQAEERLHGPHQTDRRMEVMIDKRANA